MKSQRATGVCGAAPIMIEENPKKDKYLSQGSAVPVIQIGSEYHDEPSNKPNLPPKDQTRLYNISSASEDEKIDQQVNQILKQKPEE
jgi:hypothetical protein